MSSTRVDSRLVPAADEAVLSRWLPRVRRVSCVIAVPAIAAVVIHELLAGRLGGATSDLSRASLSWAGAAVGLEVLSYLLYAAAQRRLLGHSAGSIGVRWLASLAVCAQGVSNFLPAGYLAANLLNFRELCRRGLAAPSAARLLLITSALYIGALAGLTVIAGEIAGGRGNVSLEEARIGAVVVLAALPILGVTARLLLRRGIIRIPQAWLPFGVLGYLAVRRAGIAGRTNPDELAEPTSALGDRAPGGDRSLLVLER